MITSVDHRINFLRGTQFCQWATKRLHKYIQKGFTMDDQCIKQGGSRYFRELLQRIRDGVLKTTGTDMDKILPPISRFSADRAGKKQSVIEKLAAFFEKYFGVA